MKNIILALAVLALSGCAADMVDQSPAYASASSQEITTPDGTYIVKLGDGKALVRPTVATAFAGRPIVPHMRDAARLALKKAGRNCRLTEGYANGDFFEFNFVCK